MDVLGQILKALIGDSPPNGWTALIALGVCAAYVASNAIKAKHHRDHWAFLRRTSPEQRAALADEDAAPEPPEPPKQIPPPASGKLLSAMLVLLGVGTLTRMGDRLEVARGNSWTPELEAHAAPTPPKGRPCIPACVRPSVCVDSHCQAATRTPVPPKSGPPGPHSPSSDAEPPAWTDNTPDRPGDALLTACAAEQSLWGAL